MTFKVNEKDVQIAVTPLPAYTIPPLFVSRELCVHYLKNCLIAGECDEGIQFVEELFYTLNQRSGEATEFRSKDLSDRPMFILRTPLVWRDLKTFSATDNPDPAIVLSSFLCYIAHVVREVTDKSSKASRAE